MSKNIRKKHRFVYLRTIGIIIDLPKRPFEFFFIISIIFINILARCFPFITA